MEDVHDSRTSADDPWARRRFLQTLGALEAAPLVGCATRGDGFEPDARYRIVIAHRDPGLPNWLDTEGRETDQVYWRIMLPESDVETPMTEVVPLASLRR